MRSCGDCDGARLGLDVGAADGEEVGAPEGVDVGCPVGDDDGVVDGAAVGLYVQPGQRYRSKPVHPSKSLMHVLSMHCEHAVDGLVKLLAAQTVLHV